MKKTFFLIATLLTAIFVLPSCNKDNATDITADRTTAEEIVANNDLSEQVDAEIEDNVPDEFFTSNESEDRGACAIITFAQPKGTWPNTMTIDFAAGCVKPDGRVLKGKIVVNQTNKMGIAGSVRTITFEDFYIDNVQITGSKTVTNAGPNTSGQPTFTKTGTVVLIYPNGDQGTYNINHTRIMLEGAGTPQRLDDVWSISGNDNGVNRDGLEFSVVISTLLVKRAVCPWISEGVITLTRNNKTRSLDFGDGACDRDAVLTLPDGSERDVKIRRRWWM